MVNFGYLYKTMLKIVQVDLLPSPHPLSAKIRLFLILSGRGSRNFNQDRGEGMSVGHLGVHLIPIFL